MKVRIQISKTEGGNRKGEKTYSVTYKDVDTTEEVVSAFKHDFGWCFNDTIQKGGELEGKGEKRK